MAETTDYMILGYAVAYLILVVTIGSVWLRFRAAQNSLALVERLAAEEGISLDDEISIDPAPTAQPQPKPTLATDKR